MATKYELITELYKRTQKNVAEPQEWQRFLTTACRNFRLSFDEQLLLYAQRPDATAVLEIDKWNRQFGRWVNRGATGIAVFDGDTTGRARLKYYFDVSDTHPGRFSRRVPIWTMRREYEQEVTEALENSFGELENKYSLAAALISAAKNAVEDNMQDYLQELHYYKENSFLEELDDLNIEVQYRNALQNSVAYMLLMRCGIDPSDYFTDDDFRGVVDFNTPQTLNALGVATGDIAQMCLTEISRTVTAIERQPEKQNRTFADVPKDEYPVIGRNNETERSDEHERADIHDAGRVPSAQPAAPAGAGGDAWEIRPYATPVSPAAPQSDLHQPSDQREADGASAGDRADGEIPDGADHSADGESRGRDGGTERHRSDEMGRADEQHSADGGGNGADGADLQLTSDDLAATQIAGEQRENAGGDVLPAFLNERLINAILSNPEDDLIYKKQQIEMYFAAHPDVTERAEYLKSAYQDRYTELLVGSDRTRVGYKPQEDGLLMWEGAYLSRTSESVFSWQLVAELTAQVIERGEYHINRDIKGLKSQNSQQMSLFDMAMPTAEPVTAPTEPVSYGIRYSQQVIDEALCIGANDRNSRLIVCAYFMKDKPMEENARFLMRHYGTNGAGFYLNDRQYAIWYSSEGIRLSSGDSAQSGTAMLISWEDAAKRIRELLDLGRYMPQAELDRVQDYEYQQIAESLWYLRQDFDDGAREQALLPTVNGIYMSHGGFPENTAQIAELLKQPDSLQTFVDELGTFLSAYEADRDILRFHFHRPREILQCLVDLQREPVIFTAAESYESQRRQFITMDEVDKLLRSGSTHYRLGVYSYYLEHPDIKERAKYLQSYHGDSGSYGGNDNTNYGSKGLSFSHGDILAPYAKLDWSWTKAARRIETLIHNGSFLSDEDRAAMPEYKKPVLNKKETAIAQDRQELIKAKFVEWVWKDIDRRERLCRIYNETFNSIRPRQYDGSHIRFSGMNPEITLRKHQIDAIAHIMYGGNTLLAHEVGAGKTYEMVAAAMESKRLGLCTKSLIVVPNHITEQWAAEWLQLYPSANILVATKKDFETQNRKKFCARIATGDYDAVIIGHSQFEKIPMSAERQQIIIQRQIDEIMDGIDEAKRAKAERYTVKQLERTKHSLETRLAKLNDQSRKDSLVTFEELGVDRIFIDESHYFKNLFLATKMRNVGGIAQTEAQKSSDLFMKTQYLDEITGGRGVVFATGTPISNSMVELYTIQRYLQYHTLEEMDMLHFDDWAAAFGETITAIELSPEGSGYRAKTRFAKFYNLPELMSTFKMAADIQTADMLKLPVPKANFHTEVIKPSEIQQEMVAGLAERAEKIRAGGVDPKVDNMLRITNDGRKLALDMRLINPLAADDPNGKVSTCARNIFRIWEQTTEQRGAQLVFCDLSTPKDDGSFNVYDDLKEKLMAMGIPENEIAYIHDANTEARKKELFAKVRAGQVRVLLGSTQKMGAGTNVQDRLVALHDLDCPWRPSDLAQRLGRIVRQGNQNPEVDIYRYVTENTFDAYLYQLVENKQKFIAQIMTSKSPVRVADDIDETALSYSEIKALATGNPLIIEKCNLDMEMAKLNVLKASHLSQKYALEEMVLRKYPQIIQDLKQRIFCYEQDTKLAELHPKPTEGFVGLTLMGKEIADKEAAGKAIIDVCTTMTGSGTAEMIGEYRGFFISIAYDGTKNEYQMHLKGAMTHTVVLGADVYGNITRMDNVIDGIAGKLKTASAELTETQVQMENAREEMKAPFAKETELKEKEARLKELNILLNMDQKDRSLIDDTPEEDIPDKPRPRGIER